LQQYEILKTSYPNVPGFPSGVDEIKVPAGWLIEQAGWKGIRKGNVGCYEKQALVLVNHGGARGEEVMDLAREIILSVEQKFGIVISPEVNLWDSSL
jgi:UDP-N-acetylmuramate dehydrogenase